jgi:hypothetical protein
MYVYLPQLRCRMQGPPFYAFDIILGGVDFGFALPSLISQPSGDRTHVSADEDVIPG